MATEQGLQLPGLGTVDLGAVREQLALLGHDVPDHVISGFLAEFGAAPAGAPVQSSEITKINESKGGGRERGVAGTRPVAEQDEAVAVLSEERRARRGAAYEEAYYGQHDRHLWENHGGNNSLNADHWNDVSDAEECEAEEQLYLDEEAGLEVDFANLRVSKANMRRPMEVKNVWVTGQRGEGKRPSTPQLALRCDAPPSSERLWEAEERQTRAILNGRSKRPSTAGARPRVERPGWDNSAVLPRPSTQRTLRRTEPRIATPAPHGKTGNGSFIVASASKSKRTTNATPKKTDRVARNRAMAEAWKKDKFLNHGGATKTASRPALNFHQYFSQQHAAAARERQETSREVRANTVRSLNSTASAPQEKRRDNLRFEVRSWMHGG